MDGSGHLIRPFGGEERAFRLDIDRLRALQAKCDAGPVEIIRRIEGGSWRIDDLRETIFQGLVGGGSTQLDATVIVRDHFERQPAGYAQFTPLAHDILMEAVFGPEDDDLEKPKAGETTPTPSRAASSGSGRSSARARSSAGRRSKSAE